MTKTIKWISVFVLASVISGCLSYSKTTLAVGGKGESASTTINGKTAILKDGVFTYGDKTFDVPDKTSVRIERRNDKVVRIFINGKFVYEEEGNSGQTRQ